MLIPPKVFELHRIASTETGREPLQGVRFTRPDTDNHPMACATDGRVFGFSRWVEDDWKEYPLENGNLEPNADFSMTIDNKQAKPYSKWKGNTRTRTFPILENVVLTEGETPELSTTDLTTAKKETALRPQESNIYPDLQSTMDGRSDVIASVCIDPLRLKQAIETVCAMMPPRKKNDHDIDKSKIVNIRLTADGILWIDRKFEDQLEIGVGIAPIVSV